MIDFCGFVKGPLVERYVVLVDDKGKWSEIIDEDEWIPP